MKPRLTHSPLPRRAKRVFRGTIFDVYQWRQKMFDGSYSVFEKLKRADTVSVIPIRDDGKILIIEEQQPGRKPFLSVVGGRVDEGESAKRAARREFLEETGYAARHLKLWNSFRPYDKIIWTIYTFIAYGVRKAGRPKPDPGEIIKVRFVSPEELLDLALKRRIRSMELTNAALRAKADPKEMKKLEKLLSPR